MPLNLLVPDPLPEQHERHLLPARKLGRGDFPDRRAGFAARSGHGLVQVDGHRQWRGRCVADPGLLLCPADLDRIGAGTRASTGTSSTLPAMGSPSTCSREPPLKISASAVAYTATSGVGTNSGNNSYPAAQVLTNDAVTLTWETPSGADYSWWIYTARFGGKVRINGNGLLADAAVYTGTGYQNLAGQPLYGNVLTRPTAGISTPRPEKPTPSRW